MDHMTTPDGVVSEDQPGSLPIDVDPNEQRKNPRHSPGFSPDDPAMLQPDSPVMPEGDHAAPDLAGGANLPARLIRARAQMNAATQRE